MFESTKFLINRFMARKFIFYAAISILVEGNDLQSLRPTSQRVR
jgi:hypothetical protein